MKRRSARRVGWHLLVTSLLAVAALGWSRPADAAGGGLPAGWQPLDPATLDGMRGGMVLGQGLVASFGFERLAWVNGELVSSIRVEVPDIAAMTADQAQQLARLQQLHVVQVGEGNLHSPLAGHGAGLVLQNTLDGANIKVLTTIDAGTSALGLLQAMNFQDALGQAASGALGSP